MGEDSVEGSREAFACVQSNLPSLSLFPSASSPTPSLKTPITSRRVHPYLHTDPSRNIYKKVENSSSFSLYVQVLFRSRLLSFFLQPVFQDQMIKKGVKDIRLIAVLSVLQPSYALKNHYSLTSSVKMLRSVCK